MTFDYGAFDAALTAAVGDDQSLVADLREAFLNSAKRQVDLLQRARCDANWEYAALRLKGLAASFGATHVMNLAQEAAISAPGEPTVLKKLDRAIAAIENHHE